jgi:hypothetical protein
MHHLAHEPHPVEIRHGHRLVLDQI